MRLSEFRNRQKSFKNERRLEMNLAGNRIFTQINRPDKRLVELFKDIPSSNINDEMERLYCMHDYIHPLNDVPLLGTAFTVKTAIGDNLYIHEALDRAEPGDVLVIDGGGGRNRSLAGEIMLKMAYRKGLAGVIVDGCLRDLDGIRNLPMAVYARGITPQGPYKNGPGEINVPVACGGQVVFPGDILVGDADGIVVIRPHDAEELAKRAAARKHSEEKTFELMDTDFEAYLENHKTNMRKMGAGKKIEIYDQICSVTAQING